MKHILFVDEPQMLDELQRRLQPMRRRWRMHFVENGEAALALAEQEPVEALVSDLHLPGMDGVGLLHRFRRLSPNTARILLAGPVCKPTAVEAVRHGDAYDFLVKPCSTEQLVALIEKAMEHRRRVSDERQLLEQTVKGALNAVAEVLALLDPQGVGRTAGMNKLVCALVRHLQLEPQWWHEPMTRLCQVGWATLPPALRKKVIQGSPLDEEEERLYRRHPEVGAELLARIPRLEALAEAIRYQEKHYDGTGFPEEDRSGEEIPLGGRLLKVVQDYQRALDAGLDEEEALARLHWNRKWYDPRILEALGQVLDRCLAEEVHEIDVPALEDGMVLRQDLSTLEGRLLVRKGQQVTPMVRRLVYNFWENRNLRLPILVTMP